MNMFALWIILAIGLIIFLEGIRIGIVAHHSEMKYSEPSAWGMLAFIVLCGFAVAGAWILIASLLYFSCTGQLVSVN